MNSPHLRWMIRDDLPAVLAVEKASFPHPWDAAELLTLHDDRSVVITVAERGDEIVGYMAYRLHRCRLNLLTIAVAPHHRRTGTGAALLAKMAYKVTTHRRTKATATVEDDDTRAHLFLKAHGFRATKIVRGAFTDGSDGYRFEYVPTAHDWDVRDGAPVFRAAK